MVRLSALVQVHVNSFIIIDLVEVLLLRQLVLHVVHCATSPVAITCEAVVVRLVLPSKWRSLLLLK